MAKSQTAWSNSTKNSDSWVTTGRTAVAWANGITKNATIFTITPRGTTGWGNESATTTTYTYNQAGVTYNQAGYYYNYIIFAPNQTNNKNNTNWTAQ